jgi:hypothetical protein
MLALLKQCVYSTVRLAYSVARVDQCRCLADEKAVAAGGTGVAGVVLAAPSLLGFSLWRLGDALALATGMGAKLGCSAYFVSGHDPRQIIDDLASYSPINRQLTLDVGNNRVRASLFGLAATSATWRPGLGCTLDIGDTAPLDRLIAGQGRAGATLALEQAQPTAPALQAAVAALLAADQAAGLQTRALLVLQDGKLAAESYAAGFGPDSPCWVVDGQERTGYSVRTHGGAGPAARGSPTARCFPPGPGTSAAS